MCLPDWKPMTFFFLVIIFTVSRTTIQITNVSDIEIKIKISVRVGISLFESGRSTDEVRSDLLSLFCFFFVSHTARWITKYSRVARLRLRPIAVFQTFSESTTDYIGINDNVKRCQDDRPLWNFPFFTANTRLSNRINFLLKIRIKS